MRIGVVFLAGSTLFAQSFDVASVKPSAQTVGKDYGNRISYTSTGFSVTNTTLQRLIVEAYGLLPHQVSGGPGWLDVSEYDVVAKADKPATNDQLLLMLRTLLADRFRLVFHRDQKEFSVYELVVDKGGAKVRRVADPDIPIARRSQDFRGEMQQFANMLAVRLTIPILSDPTKPGMARGTPMPVLDKTGLAGIYDLTFEVKPELGADMFPLVQRALQEQVGLKLESRKSKMDVLVVDSADRNPTAN